MLDGVPLSEIVAAALAEGAEREPLYRALLEHPICVAEVGPGAPAGPMVQLGETLSPQKAMIAVARPEKVGPPPIAVRLMQSTSLGAPVVPLWTSDAAMAEGAAERGLWPDGAVRGRVYEKGAVFPLLRGHPGAVVAITGGRSLALDAGEVVALADRQTPSEYLEGLRKLIASGRPREAVRRLALRPLYTLGHPHGGMLMFGRELPAFLHLDAAERFGARMTKQLGSRAQHGLVAAAELFKNAVRGKLTVLIDPGPRVIRLRPEDMR
ncbi:MAG: hypothetical protein EXR72_17345 [Myxococcales bacterium]|nr:hypothetical protein [Myxococcales bacterium]